MADYVFNDFIAYEPLLTNTLNRNAWYDSHSYSFKILTVSTNAVLDSEQTEDLQDIIENHEYPDSLDGDLKILTIAKAEAKDKHFHNILYNIETAPKLVPKRSFTYGALNKVEWYTDSQLTDKILEVDVTYNYNLLGFVSDRSVERKWYLSDGNPHPNTKLTTKPYYINPQDQIDEAVRRRTNNMRQINIQLMGVVPALTVADANINDMTSVDVLYSGQVFLGLYDAEQSMYVNNGSAALELAVRDDTDSQFDWFNADATALGIAGVVDVRGFIIEQLSAGARTS